MSAESPAERIARLEQELEQARAQERVLADLLEKKLSENYTHYHISRTIASIVDLQEMLKQVMATAAQAIPFDRVTVYILDESRAHLDLVFSSGIVPPEPVCLTLGEGVPGKIIRTGEHVHIHDLALFFETGDFIHIPGETRRGGSYMGIALKSHNETIGVIGMDSPVKHGLSVDDLDFMAILSHQIAAGIEKSRLLERIQQLSRLDGLTGLYNHRVFQERLDRELSRRDRTGKPLSLIMLDIDYFKKFNDSYGHQAGDSILKQLAEVITTQCRCSSIDICCRYGGEEFAIIMPELEVAIATKAAERLRLAVEKKAFRISDEHPEGRVTISIGVAGVSAPEDCAVEALVRKADDALYRSKREGRNRVSIAA